MRRERWAGLDVCLTGGPDRQGGGEGPLVVLFHGFGAPGDDLVPLWQYLKVPDDVRFLFPAAPLNLDMGLGDARAWWMLDVERITQARGQGQWEELSQEVPRGLAQARTQAYELVNVAMATLQVPPASLILGGFSQGAMLATDLVLQTDLNVSGLALLSGSLIAKDQWLNRLPSRKGLSVFQSHGTDDPILAFSMAEQLRDHMGQAGLSITWVDFPGGHEIPLEVLKALEGFLQSQFPTSSSSR